jgi:hypothetical protein
LIRRLGVLPDEIRRQLAEATSKSNDVQTDQSQDPAVLKEPKRRLTLIAFYWARDWMRRSPSIFIRSGSIDKRLAADAAARRKSFSGFRLTA